MDDLKATTRELLHCGRADQDMNVVRKHLSGNPGWPAGGRIKGARACASHFGRDRGTIPPTSPRGPVAPTPAPTPMR